MASVRVCMGLGALLVAMAVAHAQNVYQVDLSTGQAYKVSGGQAPPEPVQTEQNMADRVASSVQQARLDAGLRTQAMLDSMQGAGLDDRGNMEPIRADMSRSYDTVQQGIDTVFQGTMDMVQSSFRSVTDIVDRLRSSFSGDQGGDGTVQVEKTPEGSVTMVPLTPVLAPPEVGPRDPAPAPVPKPAPAPAPKPAPAPEVEPVARPSEPATPAPTPAPFEATPAPPPAAAAAPPPAAAAAPPPAAAAAPPPAAAAAPPPAAGVGSGAAGQHTVWRRSPSGSGPQPSSSGSKDDNPVIPVVEAPTRDPRVEVMDGPAP